MREQWTRLWTRLNGDGMANPLPLVHQNGGANLNTFVADVTSRAVAWAGNHLRNDGS